jgi:hypothetical protein
MTVYIDVEVKNVRRSKVSDRIDNIATAVDRCLDTGGPQESFNAALDAAGLPCIHSIGLLSVEEVSK